MSRHAMAWSAPIGLVGLVLAACGGDAPAAIDAGASNIDGAAGPFDGGLAISDATSEPDAPGPVIDAAPPPTALVHLRGRTTGVDLTAGPVIAEWPGVQLTFTFEGGTAEVDLEDPGTGRYDVQLDDAAPTVLAPTPGRALYTLASGLDVGPHTLRLTRRTEANFGSSTIHGLGATELVPSPSPAARHLEFVGDSITAGYGIAGVGPDCGYDNVTTTFTTSYAAQAARALDATASAIAFSGKGLTTNYEDSVGQRMPSLWQQTSPSDATPWPFPAGAPDAVIVALGTNDFWAGDPGDALGDTLADFLGDIRLAYPTAHQVVVVQSMLRGAGRASAIVQFERAVAARAAAGDLDVSQLALAEMDPDAEGYGCHFHPSQARHDLMAAELVAHLQGALGW